MSSTKTCVKCGPVFSRATLLWKPRKLLRNLRTIRPREQQTLPFPHPNPRRPTLQLQTSPPLLHPRAISSAFSPDRSTHMLRNLHRHFSIMFRHAQHISVRIFKPRDFAAARCGPNTALFVLHERILFKHHAALREPVNDRFDVAPMPPRTGAGNGRTVAAL